MLNVIVDVGNAAGTDVALLPKVSEAVVNWVILVVVCVHVAVVVRDDVIDVEVIELLVVGDVVEALLVPTVKLSVKATVDVLEDVLMVWEIVLLLPWVLEVNVAVDVVVAAASKVLLIVVNVKVELNVLVVVVVAVVVVLVVDFVRLIVVWVDVAVVVRQVVRYRSDQSAAAGTLEVSMAQTKLNIAVTLTPVKFQFPKAWLNAVANLNMAVISWTEAVFQLPRG